MKCADTGTKFEFYNGDKILKMDAVWNIIYGERTAGKTYFFLRWAVDRYLKHGEKVAIIRRYATDISAKQCGRYFNNIVRTETPDGEIVTAVEQLSDGEWNDVYYWSGRWWLRCMQDGKEVARDTEPFAYAFAISQWEHDKGGTDSAICNIIFDEFLTRPSEYSGYLNDEFSLFTNAVSSIIRLRDRVKIFLLGNSVNQYSPYFSEMLGRKGKYQEPGTIMKYRYGKDERQFVAVERTGAHASKKANNFIFAFNSNKAKMITDGAWEWDVYPHQPKECAHTMEDIVFQYFIKYDGEICQCDIVNNGKYTFTYIHRKTTPIKDEDRDLIYSLEYSPRRNWRRKISCPIDDLDRKIVKFFVEDRVFYQDNEIGDLVANYISDCRKTK